VIDNCVETVAGAGSAIGATDLAQRLGQKQAAGDETDDDGVNHDGLSLYVPCGIRDDYRMY
jgi:hypothetical protein